MSVLQSPKPNFVVQANWSCKGVEGEYEAQMNGPQMFEDVEGDTFTTFDQLTEEEVLGWIWKSMGDQGKEMIQINIAGTIAEKQTPPTVPAEKALPW